MMTGELGMGGVQQQQEQPRQPLRTAADDPQPSQGSEVVRCAADNAAQQQQQTADQPCPPLAVELSLRSCPATQLPSQIPDAEALADAGVPSGPGIAAEVGAQEPLARLPNQLLEAVLLLAAEEGATSCIRCTSTWLRDAFDCCNLRLELRGAEEEELPCSRRLLLLDLVRRSPALRSLTLHSRHADSQTAMSWPDVVEAGGQQLLKGLETLRIEREGISDLGPLAACSRLQRLELCKCYSVGDLGPLGSCPRLQHLDLDLCSSVKDLGPLAACTALQYLRLTGLSTSCIAPLAACTALRKLTMMGCQVSDIAPLAACVGLQRLVLGPLLHGAACPVRDLSALAACVQLQQLYLIGCSQVQDLAPLASCTALQYLDLRGCSQVHSLSPLASCPALRHLDLTGCSNVHDLSPLASCKALHIFWDM